MHKYEDSFFCKIPKHGSVFCIRQIFVGISPYITVLIRKPDSNARLYSVQNIHRTDEWN